MGLISSVRRLVGGGGSADGKPTQEPTHVCESCGAEFALRRPEIDPQDCPKCGGVKITSL